MKYFLFLILSASSFLMSSITHASSPEMENKRLVRDAFVSLYNKQSISTYEANWSDNVLIYASGAKSVDKKSYRTTLQSLLGTTRIDIREIGADGDWVFLHSKYTIDSKDYAVFDLIKIQDRKITEHWIIKQTVPEKSMNTNTMFSQIPTYRRTPLTVEKRNRDLAVSAYQKLFGDLDISVLEKYWHPDYIQHNPLAATGRDALRDFLVNFGILNGEKSTLAFDLVLADGNLVVTKAVMDFGGPVTVVDMFRMERGKIRQHWDVIETKQ